ncbi:MAG TPA: hypothetical protein VM942_10890, partial [Acidimicrobiales bacterium]|nr:hypothetical protein [Acidimicrobiales bacterium]
GQVALEVLFDGVRQQISLLTGLRAEGPPAALYRTDTSVGVGEPLAAKAALPVGDPATAGGVITELRLAAWIDKRGWAPAGMAFLVVTTEGWRTTQPCCDLRALKVTPTFGVTPDGGGRVEGVTAGSTSRPDPVFVVPAGFTVGSLELLLHVTFELGGTPGAVDGEPARLAIALPA